MRFVLLQFPVMTFTEWYLMQEKQYYINTFAKDGFAGPFCWYKAMVHKLTPSDDKGLY